MNGDAVIRRLLHNVETVLLQEADRCLAHARQVLRTALLHTALRACHTQGQRHKFDKCQKVSLTVLRARLPLAPLLFGHDETDQLQGPRFDGVTRLEQLCLAGLDAVRFGHGLSLRVLCGLQVRLAFNQLTFFELVALI